MPKPRHGCAPLVLLFATLWLGCDDTGGRRPDAGAVSPGSDAPVLGLEAGDAAAVPSSDALIGETEAGTLISDDAGTGQVAPPVATVIVLPDTQLYASDHPAIFAAQTQWIVDHRQERGIALVLHEGDLVDSPNDPHQWDIAYADMHILDNLVPYLVAVGNHDEDAQRNADWLNSKFAVWMFASRPWFGGTFAANKIDNSYALVDIADRKWLVLSLECAPRNAVVTWADGVLRANPDRPAIVLTHGYLYTDGNRYSASAQPAQSFEPSGYFTPIEGSNDGEELWQKLILPNRNVQIVLSGHALHNAAVRRTDTRPDGTRVHQILANYQTCGSGPCSLHPAPFHYYPGLPSTTEACDPSSACVQPSALSCAAGVQPIPCELINGGNGFLRIMEFDTAKRQLRVHTYSPSLDQSLTDDANDFVLSLD